MVERLTELQHEAVRCTQEGMTNAEIAQRLGISDRAVKEHLKRAYERLGLTGGGGARTKAAIMCWCHDHETHAARLLRQE